MNLKKDMLVQIDFVDHCKYSNEILKTSIVGWIIEFNKEKIVVNTWKVTNRCSETESSNVELYAIARVCVSNIRKLQFSGSSEK